MQTAPRKSLSSSLVETLKERMRSGELTPGDRLPTERALVADMGVSRTVVREAVARLAAEGLVEPRQGSGVFVTDQARLDAFEIGRQEMENVKDVANLLELRLAVETEMAGLAAERRSRKDVLALKSCMDVLHDLIMHHEDALEADMALHLAIATATGNQYFYRFLEFIGPKLVPPRWLIRDDRDENYRQSYLLSIHREHEAIVKAIIEGNARAARAAARNHLLAGLVKARQKESG